MQGRVVGSFAEQDRQTQPRCRWSIFTVRRAQKRPPVEGGPLGGTFEFGVLLGGFPLVPHEAGDVACGVALAVFLGELCGDLIQRLYDGRGHPQADALGCIGVLNFKGCPGVYPCSKVRTEGSPIAFVV